MLKYVLSQNLVIFHSLFQIHKKYIVCLFYLYSLWQTFLQMPCAKKASKRAKLQCGEFSPARASMHSRQPLQLRNINYTVVLDLLLKLSSLWKLRWLLQRFQSTFRAPRMPWKPDFICLGTCFKFQKCKNNLALKELIGQFVQTSLVKFYTTL